MTRYEFNALDEQEKAAIAIFYGSVNNRIVRSWHFSGVEFWLALHHHEVFYRSHSLILSFL
ncbi:MAG: hypothetical protein M3O71_03130 [Bacteroidota bacterium]|nr:hypothetical protein [Bacteroidota bacterium]